MHPLRLRLLSLPLLALLNFPAHAQAPGTVTTQQKFASGTGGFTGVLEDGDGFGRSLAVLEDLDGDGLDELAVGAYRDDDGARDAGAVWILFFGIDGKIRTQQKIGALSGGFAGTLRAGDRFGASLASVGDLNGDGVDDLVVGAPGTDDGGTNRGAYWALFLKPDGTVARERRVSASAGGFGGVLDDGDSFGSALAPLGDLDGDGTLELAVGASGDDDGGPNRGALWIVSSASDGSVVGQAKVSQLVGGFPGTIGDGDGFAGALAASPAAPAGTALIAVGALGDDDGGPNRGAVWILLLDAGRQVRGAKKLSSNTGVPLLDGDRFGASVAFVGDVDDDGLVDLAAGAPFADLGGSERGAVHVIYLRADGTRRASQVISAVNGGFGGVLADGDRFGSSVAALGDLDGDGNEDLATGAYRDGTGGADRGAAWVTLLRGCPDAAVTPRNGTGTNSQRLSSPGVPTIFGSWQVDIDCTGHAPGFVAHVATAAPVQGLFTSLGEVLIDLSGPVYFVSRGTHAGGVHSFSYTLPTDISFCAFQAYTQAIVGGSPGLELTNALDFVTGR